MIVTLENTQKRITIPKDLLETITKAMNIVAKREKLSPNTEVDITIVTNGEIHKLNKAYRGVDRPTDVLSFALDEGEEEPALAESDAEHLLGDIIISAPTAKAQAEEFGHGLKREFTYLAVHGILHLLGYDHMKAKDKKVMRKQEEAVLREMDLSEEFFGG